MIAPRPADQLRRHHDPPAPTSMKNGAAKMIVSRAVAASPNRNPMANWRGSIVRRSRHVTVRGSIGGGASGSSNPGSSSRAAGSARIASPTASISRPTATMWAWYQVVASWALYQNTVPNANRIVVARRATHGAAESTEHPPADRDVDRGQQGEQRLVVRRQAADRDERHQEEGRKGRERQAAARDAVRAERPAGRPGRGRCRAYRARTAPGSGWRSGPRGRPTPATRNGRSSDRSGWRGRSRRRPRPGPGR